MRTLGETVNAVPATSIQQALIKLGYPVQPTGIYDEQTNNYIRYFQNNHYPQAPALGVADAGTWNAIIQETNKQTAPLKYWLENHMPIVIGGAGLLLLGLGALFLGKKRG